MLPLIYHPCYTYPFPRDHRFPMAKFALIEKYLNELGLLKKRNLFIPKKNDELLELVHCQKYLELLKQNSVEKSAWRRVGLPWSEQLIERTFMAPQGTLETCRQALKYGLASHLAGGTHHAFSEFGSGFCILNDLAYAAKSLVETEGLSRVVILDLDVHQGDGTAAIFENEPRVTTISIHCKENFPFRKQQSDYDFELSKGSGWNEYYPLIQRVLMMIVHQLRPEIVIYDAGVDVFSGDTLGGLELSENEIYQRDLFVINNLVENHIPVATVIGGGYDKDQIKLAKRHSLVHQASFEVFSKLLS